MSVVNHPLPESRSKLERSTNSENSLHEPQEPTFPEGGLNAWLVVLGGFVLSISTFGYAVSFGTFQQYYQLTLLKDRSSSDIAWIGSLQYALLHLPGLPSGRLFDLGYFRPLLLTSLAAATVGNFLVAECTEYWHFVLCQGVLLGISVGCIYSPCIAAVSHWFKKRRPLAFSIVSFGSSVGGIIYPVIFRNLVPHVGFKWTIRTIAFINLVTFVIAAFTLRTRLPRPKVLPRLLDVKAFITPGYCVYVFSTVVNFLGLYTPLIFISVGAVFIGMDPNFAFYLVAIANASSAIGRVLSGALALRFGPLNVMALFMVLAAACTYIWPFVDSHSGYIAITVFYGFSSGPFISLFAAPTAQMGDPHDFGRRLGLQTTFMAFGALGGPPISGAIEGNSRSFHDVGVYAGTMILGSSLIMFLAKYLVLGKIFTGKM
ncbi:major facilitator superfamily domain-containing protein [Mycena albidolilacea]|uniref:Major facilitator superfamily domain-containing protein n=1 Tax=Mycena albidolilacea TaxID=1033008 RepID=A0AAD7AG88_9AGAR|nr:major facilitator superfamily domain-containing protein [Mycena albidolilacea]